MGFCVIVFPADMGGYVAACLEKDIVTQGHTIEEAHHEMEVALFLHILTDLEAGLPPLASVPNGLQMYRKAFMGSEIDLRLEALSFQGGSANDATTNQQAQALLAGPRHYRYSHIRPEAPPISWF